MKPQNVNRDPSEKENENKDSQPIDKKVLKLPEAQFREIDDYVIPEAPPLPPKYYKFVEKTPDELDKEVEYDMDEEDVAWLRIMNEKREQDNLAEITENQFELLMDRLEKESYFHVQTNGSGNYSPPVDDDAICCVCMDGEATNTNVILFCDLCNLAVHQECYGVPYIPEGQWLCRRCLQSPSRSVECCLCPNRGGAFKQTDDGRWAHVVCGLWIPEVRFANTVFLEPIDSIANIPPARWKLICRVCRQRGVGACIQCHKNSCYIAFHVTCGLLAGLHMKMETVREAGPKGTSITVRKTAWCDQHTPADSDAKPRLDDIAALGINTPKNKARSPKKAGLEQHPLPILFRGLMNFSPQCPWDKVQKIASMVDIQKKNLFIQRLMAYWTLKRQTRNGVPLIRRLQFAKASKSEKPETPQKNAHHAQKRRESEPDEEEEEKVKKKQSKIKKKQPTVQEKAAEDFKKMLEERKKMRRLRQDLERVRLLCELIRKREQRKREIIHSDAELKELQLNPFLFFLRRILDLLQENDTQEIFKDPVDIKEVPDYLDHISTPMDFTTMKKKLDNFTYLNLDDLEADFTMMVENCLSYNEKDTIFYRAGTKMRDIGGSILRQAKRQAEQIGFDEETGQHLEGKGGKKKEDVSDEQLMKEIDGFLNDETRDNLDYDEHLKRLLVRSDKAAMIHHPAAKTRRQKALKVEIQKIRRKMSIEKLGPSMKVGKKGKEKEGEEEDDKEDKKKTPGDSAKKKGRQKVLEKPLKAGRKRGRSSDKEEAEDEVVEVRKRKKTDDDTRSDEKSEKQKTPGGKANRPAGGSPAKSPAGVNRRNAVLFTRKKVAASEERTDSKKKDKKDEEEKKEESRLSSLRGRRKSQGDDSEAHDEFEFKETEVQSPPPKSPRVRDRAKGKGRGKVRRARFQSDDEGCSDRQRMSDVGPVTGGPRIDNDPMFKTYRQGGMLETDDDTGADSAMTTTDEDTESDDDDSYAEMSALNIPLEPLDLVWAKCRGYPWYPALIINPKMPRTGYFHNGVPIPVPPVEVLQLADSHTQPHYLILFFDHKRTWQWLPRDKLEPLGVDAELDKAKLVQSKKPGERKAVKKAYEDSIWHRCRVTGETVDLNSPASCDDQGDCGDKLEEKETEGRKRGDREKSSRSEDSDKRDKHDRKEDKKAK